MDQIETGAVGTENTPAQEQVVAPAPETTDVTPSTDVTPAEGVADTKEAASVYTPNFKYSVLDEEKEMPEKVKALIKTEEDEKFFKELFEKSDGLDHVKTKHQSLKDNFVKLDEEYKGLVGELQELKGFYQKGDLDSFFQSLAIPEQKILEWAYQKVQYKQMAPEQRQLLDARREAEMRAYHLEKQNSSVMSEMERFKVDQKRQEIRMTLNEGSVKSFMDEFDKRAGKKGAFLEELVERGDRAFQRGKDLHPMEVAQEIMRLYKVEAQMAEPKTIGAPKKGPPVITNVGSKASSPVGQAKVKTLADVKKLQAQFTS